MLTSHAGAVILPLVLFGCGSPPEPEGDYTAPNGSEMILLAAGEFQMGCTASQVPCYGDDTEHTVTLTHPFWLGRAEVTRSQWEADPNHAEWLYWNAASTDDCPADALPWYEAAMYANWLSEEEGLDPCYGPEGNDVALDYLADVYTCPGYRLPTEAEWEYAARAGQDTTWSGSNTVTDVAWTDEANPGSGQVGCELAENAWGFCDMSGNAWEWTNDWYDAAHGGYADGSDDVDPVGPVRGEGEGYGGSLRVLRGGHWGFDASWARNAFRTYDDPVCGSLTCGLRLARTSSS